MGTALRTPPNRYAALACGRVLAATLFSPAEVGLIGNTDQLADNRDGLALGQLHVALTKLVDDLFGHVTLAAHGLDPP